MTKAELIATVAKEAKIPKASAEKALNAFTSSVMKALKKGDKLTLTGFGTFSVAKRKARTGRNPQTGKEIKIPARKVAKFKAGKSFKECGEVTSDQSHLFRRIWTFNRGGYKIFPFFVTWRDQKMTSMRRNLHRL